MNKEELKDTLWSGFASWEIGGQIQRSDGTRR
jgi:hypothetical protein